MKEYLPTLQRRQCWLSERRSFRPGDVVLVVEDQVNKEAWPLGLVREVFPSSDGRVRTVKVKTKDGEIVRDIRRICLLEADDSASVAEAADNSTRDETADTNKIRRVTIRTSEGEPIEEIRCITRNEVNASDSEALAENTDPTPLEVTTEDDRRRDQWRPSLR